MSSHPRDTDSSCETAISNPGQTTRSQMTPVEFAGRDTGKADVPAVRGRTAVSEGGHTGGTGESRTGLCTFTHPDGPPDADVGLVCHRCYARLRSSLLELVAVAGWLHTQLAVVASGGLDERVAGSREDPIPLRTDVLDLIGPDSRAPARTSVSPRFLVWYRGVCVGDHDTWDQAAAQHRDLMRAGGVTEDVIVLAGRRLSKDERRALTDDEREQLQEAREQWQVRPTGRGGTDQTGEESFRAELAYWVGRCVESGDGFAWPERSDLITPLVTWLASHLRWLVDQDWCGEFAEAVAQLHRQASRVAPWRAETRVDPNPCTACGRRAILLHLAEGRSTCEKRLSGCGRTMTWDHQRVEGTA
jgi:hypothetical protein